MSGLLALLDDVAALTKAAAASIDDVAAGAAKAGAKAAGVVIDDAAVTPQYITGITPARELPIIWRIAKGSVRNKLVFLMPVALLLAQFAPWAVTPLLMLGGAYLSYEGAEKIAHLFVGKASGKTAKTPGTDTDSGQPQDQAKSEEATVSGAITTDFILSAEIMTITLSAIPEGPFWTKAVILAVVGLGITVLIYGAVALIVKADDLGLLMARRARFAVIRRLGCAILRFMPWFMSGLTAVGTVAMLWVGGSILLHGAEVLGWPDPAHLVEAMAETTAALVPEALTGATMWTTRAGLDAIAALAIGLALIPVTAGILRPLAARIPRPGGRKNAG